MGYDREWRLVRQTLGEFIEKEIRMSKEVLLVGSYNRINKFLDTEAQMYLKKVFSAPSLGLHRIASYLRPEHNVVVYDPNMGGDPYKYLKSKAKAFDIIGFSLTHAILEYDLSLMWCVRKANKGCVIVAGGEEATFDASLLEEHSPANIIVMGEGEKAMAAICEGAVTEGRVQMPLGNEFRDATFAVDFASIPYETYWQLLEERNKNFEETRTVRLFTSNLCPWGCLFCSATNFLSYAYGKQPKHISLGAEDLMILVKRIVEAHPDARTIFFQDDNFIMGEAGEERVFKLCAGILESREKGEIPDTIRFMCETRVDTVTKPILESLASAGFRLVFYGVESFSKSVLDEFKKGVLVEQIEQALEWTYETGMVPYITIILTSPNCTIEDVRQTVKKCREHSRRGALLGVNLYTIPLPGSELVSMTEDCIEYRRVKIPGTSISFDKAEKIIPRDEKVRRMLKLTSACLKDLNLDKIGKFISHDKSILDLDAVSFALRKV